MCGVVCVLSEFLIVREHVIFPAPPVELLPFSIHTQRSFQPYLCDEILKTQGVSAQTHDDTDVYISQVYIVFNVAAGVPHFLVHYH